MNMMSQTLRALNQSDFIRLSLGTLYRFDQALGIRQHPGPSPGLLRMPLFWSLNRWIFFFILFEFPKVLISTVPKNVSNGRRTKDKLIGKV